MSDTDGQDTDFDSDASARIDFKTEDLIAEVEMRPIIYNTQLKDYNNRALKQQMWQEVCAALVKKWDSISKTEKIAIERYVQKRWKHTRDAFTRHYRNSQDPKDRFEKKYIYHDLMLFLTPHFTERQKKSYGLNEVGEPPEKKHKTSDENQPSEKKPRHSHENRIEKEMRNLSAALRASTQTYPKNGKPPETMPIAANTLYHNGKRMEMPCERSVSMSTPVPTCFPCNNPYEKSLLSMLHEKINEEPDEDKHFALMLVPMLKKLDEDQKHYAKIEILKVIRNARKMPSSSDCLALDAERYNGFANSNDYSSTFESAPRMLVSSPEAEPIDCSVPVDSFPSASKSLLKGYTGSKNKLRIKLKK